MAIDERLTERMNLERVYLLRHGSYDGERPRLNAHGIGQMERIARDLQHMLSTENAIVYYSSGKRATESAHIISRELHVPSVEVSWLIKMKEDDVLDFPYILEQIEELKDKSKSVILVSNGKFIKDIVRRFSEHYALKNPLEEIAQGDTVLVTFDHLAPAISMNMY